MEGVWKERHRLESELSARREENERLRAGEDAARNAAAVLDGRVEELSAALKQERARAKREAEAAVAAEARDAMEALRRQLDDLRKEVERTKEGREALLPQGGGGNNDRPPMEGISGAGTGGSFHRGEAGRGPANANIGAGWGSTTKERRGGRGGGGSTTAEEGVAPPASPPLPSLTVLEGEFQRLRAKYEKAKGRIVALEELVAASRRVSGQARKEFQVREPLGSTELLFGRVQINLCFFRGGGASL